MEDRGLTKPIDPLKASAAGITEKVTGENSMLLAETIKLAQAMPHGFSGLMKRFEDKGLPKVFARFAPRVAAKV